MLSNAAVLLKPHSFPTDSLTSEDLTRSINDLAVPDRELFAHIKSVSSARHELAWAQAAAPDEFWKSLFARGIIHHALYTQIRHAPALPSAEAFSNLSTTCLRPLSASAAGRELLIHYFRSLPPLDAYALAWAVIPTHQSALGHFPLGAPHRLTPEGVSRFAAEATPQLLWSWWDCIAPGIRVDGRDSRPHSPLLQPELAEKLSILSFNVWGVPGLARKISRRFSHIGLSLGASRYDLVGLQEMWDPSALDIVRLSGFPYHATGREFPGLAGRSGLVILSKLPLYDVQELSFKAKGGIECIVSKGALAARAVSRRGKSLLVVNTHLASPPERGSSFFCSPKRTDEIRSNQVRELADWVASIRRPEEELIALGDFNSPEGGPHYEELRRGVGTDLFRERLPFCDLSSEASSADERLGLTFDPISNPLARHTQPARLDYIFGSFINPSRVRVATRRVFTKQPHVLSDHYGVEVDLHWS